MTGQERRAGYTEEGLEGKRQKKDAKRRGDICKTDVVQSVSELQFITSSYLCCLSSIPEARMKGNICRTFNATRKLLPGGHTLLEQLFDLINRGESHS